MELGIGALVCRGPLATQGRMTDSLTEQALIDRCRRQDADAFGRFVDLYQGRVLGFVRRMVPDADEAADITQEVFIRAFQSFRRFDQRSTVKTWLFKIAHNLCVDWSRRNRRSPITASLSAVTDEHDEIEVADSRWEPQRLVLDDELATAIEGAILSMSDKLRSVLLLHDREDLAYEEIASLLGIPIGTVKSRLFLARTHLQGALQPYLSSERAQA